MAFFVGSPSRGAFPPALLSWAPIEDANAQQEPLQERSLARRSESLKTDQIAVSSAIEGDRI